MLSSSRFSARPSAPPSNSSSSFTAALGSPATRAMPSPTSSTRPTCSVSIVGLEALDVLAQDRRDVGRRRWSALPFESLHALLQLVETVAHGAVDHRVADRGDDAAQHRRVDDDLHLDVLAGGLRQRVGEPLPLRRRRAAPRNAPRRRSCSRLCAASSTNRSTIAGRSWPRPAPTMNVDERLRRSASAWLLEQLVDDRWRAGRRACPGWTRVDAQLVVALDDPGEAEELVLHLARGCPRPRDLEQRLRVGVDALDRPVALSCSRPG